MVGSTSGKWMATIFFRSRLVSKMPSMLVRIYIYTSAKAHMQH